MPVCTEIDRVVVVYQPLVGVCGIIIIGKEGSVRL